MSVSSDPISPSPRSIPLRVANKTAYVWDVDDIAAIRAHHRICGVLTGTLPHLSQQNVFLGVPLVLLPEEAALLIDTGAAVLVDDPLAHRQPAPAALRKWQQAHDEAARVQIAALESKSTGAGGTDAGRANSEAAVRKRREREEKKRRKAEEEAARARAEGGGDAENVETVEVPAAAPAVPLDLFVPLPTTSEPSTSSPAIDPSSSKPHSASASAHPYTITIPAPSSSLAWYDSAECTYTTLDAARAAGVWDYPATLAERARCGVFKDLWKQGYFMGGGIKFGGEYLVYPGDPLRYHSHFAASVVESPITKLRPMEIVAHGRLGTATKKAHLLCGWDDEKQEVSYLSIEWAGFG